MPDYRSIENDFLQKIIEIIEKYISSEQFGVSELARETNMSRSNLLRKIKKLTGLSVSQFIRQIRLEFARDILEEGALTVSEVSYKVGFSSTSYFIKCFRENYGYPPGEVGKHNVKATEDDKEIEDTETNEDDNKVQKAKKTSFGVLGTYIIIVLFAIVLFFLLKPLLFKPKISEKSIAVLPFKNDSNDTTNVYFINGLMESTLNNLQKIKDLRVISRTSVEKYRYNPKTTPEIAKELDVNYIIEGSGQKIGDQILLNIQLIDAKTDKHLWAEQYNRKAEDIFALQSEVAKNIAEKIEVIISPEVQQSIDKIPTNNLEAYDFFLQGLDLLNKGLPEYARNSVPYLKRAIALDSEFARAYAAAAMAYYFIDEHKANKLFSDSINYYADLALFYDSQLPQSLIAKALFYMAHEEFNLALPYFEKVLEYNPNSDVVYKFLVVLYANHFPNTAKYLEYALKGLKMDILASMDSATASYSYLHIGNAFIQSGFVEEAEMYTNKSLELAPGNLYAEDLKAFIQFAKHRDLAQLKGSLLKAFNKDTTRIDLVQEIGKAYYFLKDYKKAYAYYKPFVEIREKYNLAIYREENGRIGFVFEKAGNKQESEKYFEEFKSFAENDHSIYKHYYLSMYYSCRNEKEKALEHLEQFSKQNNYYYWIIIFTPIEPLFDNIKNLPEFKDIFKEIETRFWKNHERLKSSLEKKKLISGAVEGLN